MPTTTSGPARVSDMSGESCTRSSSHASDPLLPLPFAIAASLLHHCRVSMSPIPYEQTGAVPGLRCQIEERSVKCKRVAAISSAYSRTRMHETRASSSWLLRTPRRLAVGAKWCSRQALVDSEQ